MTTRLLNNLHHKVSGVFANCIKLFTACACVYRYEGSVLCSSISLSKTRTVSKVSEMCELLVLSTYVVCLCDVFLIAVL